VEEVRKIGVFRLISRFISKTIQDTAIVTTEDEQKRVCDLSNDAIYNDLELPVTQISGSRQLIFDAKYVTNGRPV